MSHFILDTIIRLRLFDPKKTKFIKYPRIAISAPQLQQNLVAVVADLKAGNSKFVSHGQRALQTEPSYFAYARARLLSYLSQKNKHCQTFEEETSNLGGFHTRNLNFPPFKSVIT